MDSLVLIANLNSLKSLVKNLCYPNYLIYAPERISSFQQIDKNIKIMSILQMPPTSGRRSLTVGMARLRIIFLQNHMHEPNGKLYKRVNNSNYKIL